jgi:HPt (histidine-containing phosphotransfer) domain-containing protein
VHTLKAACATVGASSMTELCKTLEAQTGDVSSEEISDTLIALNCEFIKVKDKLVQFKNS